MNDFYDRLDELYESGDLVAIEEYISGAVDASEEASVERAGLYNELAGFYRGISRYDESEDIFFKALAIFKMAGMELSPQYATVLLNLAGLFRIKGEADRAVALFLDAKKMMEDAGVIDSYEYVSVLNNLALAYQEKGEYEDALSYAARALELMRAGEANEHEIATSLNNLAATNISLGRLKEAGSLIAESLEMYDAMPEPNVHHAAALTTKAVIACREGAHREALEGFKRALSLTQRFFGENLEYAICRRNISDVYEMLGDIPHAIEELSDAVRILNRLLGPDHPSARSSREKLERLGQMSGQSGVELSV